jgi:tyrosinase
MGRFADFRNVHSSAGDPEAHQNAGFPPWHRAFLLDLERELQQIDPSVALPYWRFDEPAPNLFTRDFMGVTDPSTGRVLFSATNPFQFWATDGVIGIVRRPRFNTQTQRATALQGPVTTEPETFLLGLSATSPPIRTRDVAMEPGHDRAKAHGRRRLRAEGWLLRRSPPLRASPYGWGR